MTALLALMNGGPGIQSSKLFLFFYVYGGAS